MTADQLRDLLKIEYWNLKITFDYGIVVRVPSKRTYAEAYAHACEVADANPRIANVEIF